MKKPKSIEDVRNEHDLIRFMGRFPDKIYEGELTSESGWRCLYCGKEYPDFNIPAPCSNCGYIGFEILK